jgi:hypothetical protein
MADKTKQFYEKENQLKKMQTLMQPPRGAERYTVRQIGHGQQDWPMK